MSATASTTWFWSDWLGDQAVRRLTPAERGVWIDLLALAAAANPIGYVCDDKGRALSLEEIARVTNVGSPDEASELIAGIIDKGACSRDRAGRLFNRRMVRDAEAHAKKAGLAAKRSQAGHSGAGVTALKYFGKQILPRQMPRHLPRHLPRETLENPSLKKERIFFTEGESERAAACGKVEQLAAAARVEPQQAAEEARRKRPDEMSRTEWDEMIARKRGG